MRIWSAVVLRVRSLNPLSSSPAPRAALNTMNVDAGGSITVQTSVVQGHTSPERRKAYHYFPTQEALIVDVRDIAPGLVEVEKLVVGSLTTKDVKRRLLLLLDTFGQIVLTEEAQLRTALRDTTSESPADIRRSRASRCSVYHLATYDAHTYGDVLDLLWAHFVRIGLEDHHISQLALRQRPLQVFLESEKGAVQ